MGIYAQPELHDWFVSEYPNHCKSKLDMGKWIEFEEIIFGFRWSVNSFQPSAVSRQSSHGLEFRDDSWVCLRSKLYLLNSTH
jgi:hypothetical protein